MPKPHSYFQSITIPIAIGLVAWFISWFVKEVQKELADAERKRTTRTKPSVRQNITIVDNFIKNKELLDSLQHRSMWEVCSEGDGGWWDKQTEPKHIWEKISSSIWQSWPEYYNAAEGFEWWCNIGSKGTPMKWHVDKDEQEWRENRKLLQPIMGSVYYGYNHRFTGGKLHTVDAEASSDPSTLIELGETTQITAEFNRLVIFNASLWHGVSEIFEGERFVFVVNAWRRRPSGL